MARTDNDTWDLATSVGATATMVAAARAIATKADNPLIDDRFADPLVRAVGVNFFTRWATGELDAADLDDSESAWRLEHMPDAITARTRYFDSFFLDATQAGIRQAVILASGLDARAYRLAWPADMTVFEIDQPRVIEFKSTTLAALRRPDRRPAHPIHRPAARLARRPARRGSRQRPAHRLDRRGSVRLSAAASPGPPAGQRHRAQRRYQPTGHRNRPGHIASGSGKNSRNDAQSHRQMA
jgi:Leucine carboxyl methyltransferase